MAESYVEGIRARYPGIRTEAADESRLAEQLAVADILLAFEFPAALVSHMGRLRWYQSTGAGVDTVLPVAGRLPNMVITNAKGIHGDVIADYVMACIPAMTWNLRQVFANQSQRKWVRQWLVPLSAMTLGVVGVGAIGAEICRRAKTAGMTVLGYRRNASATSEYVDEMFGGDQLHSMLKRCDAVVLVVPRTAETAGMIGAKELACMKRSAILVNVARGGIVDERALAIALERGDIGGAVIDVFDQEPLPPENPFWSMPNVVVTPHMAGGTADYVDRVLSIFSENFDRFFAGRPLRNLVDPARGY
jgi:phosphoglycerate dehydrogenase-like enzyme